MDYKDSRYFISQNKDIFYDHYDLTEDVYSCNELTDVRVALWKRTPPHIYEETKELEKRVVKTFRKIFGFDRDKVMIQIKIMQKMDHLNCVKMIEWFEDDYHIFMVLYREGHGKSLFDSIILRTFNEW